MNATAIARIVLLWPLVTLIAGPDHPALASPYQDAPHEVGLAAGSADKVIESCLLAAASAHRVPPAVLVILLNVEGGKLGRVSANTNGTVDIGPMQVNEIWLPELSRHWRAPVGLSFLALRDNFCANAEAGAYILRKGLDEAHGDFWSGVGIYHSHDPAYKAAYLRKVFEQALRLQAEVARTAPAPQPAAAQPNAGGR
jgi:hypothetical protein